MARHLLRAAAPRTGPLPPDNLDERGQRHSPEHSREAPKVKANTLTAGGEGVCVFFFGSTWTRGHH